MSKQASVPRTALVPLVRWLLGRERADVILGDVEEGYRRARRSRGARAADRWYRRDLVRTLLAVLADRARRSWSRRRGRAREQLRAAATDGCFALRSLRRRPAFALLAVALLGAGIGGATTLLSLVDGLLLRPLPYPHPARIVTLWARSDGGGNRDLTLPAPAAAFVRDRTRSLQQVAFIARARSMALDTGGDETIAATIGSTDPELFALLGAAPLLGRLRDTAMSPATTDNGSLVLGERLWSTAFGRDPSVIGRTVRVDGVAVQIAAVVDLRLTAPAAAGLPRRIDAWLPLPAPLERMRRDDGRLLDQDSDNTGLTLARLADGVNIDTVAAELSRIGPTLRDAEPAYAAAGLRLRAGSLADEIVAPVRPLARVLSLGAVLLLTLAAANVATLLLAQASRRRRELAIRAAVGADEVRLRRQQLLERAALVLIGAAGGGLLAATLLPALLGLLPPALPRSDSVHLSMRVLAGASASAAAALALLSLLLGVGGRRAGGGGRIATGGRRGAGRPPLRGRGRLVAAQVALCFLFLVTAGLLGRSLASLRRVDPGFVPDGVLTFQLSLRSPERWRGPAERARFVFDLSREIERLPRASTAGVTAALPLSGASWSRPYGRPGQPPDAWRGADAEFRAVTSGYFEAMGTRIVGGRGFSADEDLHEDRRVAIVDESLAALLRADGDVVGTSIGIPVDGDAVQAEIVGVVERVRQRTLSEPALPTVYVPFRQEASRDIAFAIRTTGEPGDLLPEVRALLARSAPELALHDIRSLRQAVDADLAPNHFAVWLAAAFAALAVTTAVVGLYALMAFAVTTRGHEIGLRKAVGADPASIRRLVLASGLSPAIAGLTAGVPLTLVAVSWLRGLLHGVGTADPVVWSLAVAIVLATAVAATILPALRAASIDAARALRRD